MPRPDIPRRSNPVTDVVQRVDAQLAGQPGGDAVATGFQSVDRILGGGRGQLREHHAGGDPFCRAEVAQGRGQRAPQRRRRVQAPQARRQRLQPLGLARRRGRGRRGAQRGAHHQPQREHAVALRPAGAFHQRAGERIVGRGEGGMAHGALRSLMRGNVAPGQGTG